MPTSHWTPKLRFSIPIPETSTQDLETGSGQLGVEAAKLNETVPCLGPVDLSGAMLLQPDGV